MIAPTAYRAPPHNTLGIWPFTSEKEAVIGDILRKYDWAFYKKMVPQMSLWQSTKIFFIGPDWARDFFKRYMVVAEEIGPYTDANYETYKERLAVYYDADLLKKMLDTLADMYMNGDIPRALYDPGTVVLDDESPLDKALIALKEGARETGRAATKLIIVGVVVVGGYFVYKDFRKKRRAA